MILHRVKSLGAEIARRDSATISFDVFDTLLTRSIDPPDELKRCAAHHAVRELGLSVSPAGLLAQRRRAERELSDLCRASGGDGECSIAAVYTFVCRYLGLEAAIADRMRACELEVEKAYVGVMPGIPALLQRLSQTKRLIAVSDTYLPEPLLTELLRQAGLLAYISAVYPSCKYGVNKGSGRLFQKVLELEELEPSELLHIGDNFLGDYYSPRSIGIPSLLVRDRDNLARRAALNAYHSLSGFSPHWHAASFAARLLSEPGVAGPGPYYRWGRATVGPLLVNFVHLLCLELQQSRPDAVFFLAREGFLLKKLYETMSAELFGAPPAEPRYLCVSRYTAFLAALERAGER